MVNSKTKELISYLKGTSIDLEQGLEDLGFNENEIDLFELESWISYCDGCGWWYEYGEVESDPMIGLQFCRGCID